MAIYHYRQNGVSVSDKESAVAASSYMSGKTLHRDRTGEDLSFRHAERVIETGVWLDDGAPARWSDPEVLWNEAESAWPGGKALVARRENMAIPKELGGDKAAMARLMRDYCERCARELGERASQWAVHDDTGSGNFHGHRLRPVGRFDAEGFVREKPEKRTTKCYLCRRGTEEEWVPAGLWKDAKEDGWEKVYNFSDGERRTMAEARALGLGTGDRASKHPVAQAMTLGGELAKDAEIEELVEHRRIWAECVNAALGRIGSDERVSHLSYAEQGLAKEPHVNLSRWEWKAERDAKARAEAEGREYRPVTERGLRNAEIDARNYASYNVGELCRIAAERAESAYQWRTMLEEWGVAIDDGRPDGLWLLDTDRPEDCWMALSDVAPELAGDGLERALDATFRAPVRAEGAAILAERRAKEAEAARIQSLKDSYLKRIDALTSAYRREVAGMRGKAMDEIPKLKFPRPPKEVADDVDVQRRILAGWRKADEWRNSAARDAPRVAPQGQQTGGYREPTYQPTPQYHNDRPAPSQER